MTHAIAGKELKALFGTRFHVTGFGPDIEMPRKSRLVGKVMQFRVEEELNIQTLFADDGHQRYFNDLKSAVQEAAICNNRFLVHKIAEIEGMISNSAVTMFRYRAKTHPVLRFLPLIHLDDKMQERVGAVLENYEFLTNLEEATGAPAPQVKAILDGEVYCLDAPILEIGSPIYRVSWQWPQHHGVTLDQLSIRGVRAYDGYGDDSVDFSLHYDVASYGEDNEQNSRLRFKDDGTIGCGSQATRYFFDRAEAEAFQRAKKDEIIATVENS